MNDYQSIITFILVASQIYFIVLDLISLSILNLLSAFKFEIWIYHIQVHIWLHSIWWFLNVDDFIVVQHSVDLSFLIVLAEHFDIITVNLDTIRRWVHLEGPEDLAPQLSYQVWSGVVDYLDLSSIHFAYAIIVVNW